MEVSTAYIGETSESYIFNKSNKAAVSTAYIGETSERTFLSTVLFFLSLNRLHRRNFWKRIGSEFEFIWVVSTAYIGETSERKPSISTTTCFMSQPPTSAKLLKVDWGGISIVVVLSQPPTSAKLLKANWVGRWEEHRRSQPPTSAKLLKAPPIWRIV